MPTPPRPWVVGAPERPLLRRLRHLLALTAVAFPLVASAASPGVVSTAVAPDAVPDAAPAVQVLVVDGSNVRLGVTDAPDVARALTAFGITVGPLDQVVPAGTTPLDGPTTVVLQRIALEEERVSSELPAPVIRVEDAALPRGLVAVDETGRDGSRVVTNLVLLVDGAVVSRLPVATEVVRPPAPRIERVGVSEEPGDSVWDALARCESRGRWDAVRTIDGRVRYRGGLQFADVTWDAFRPDGFPELASDATRDQQIAVAELVLADQGWGAWPSCARRLGLR